MFDASVYASRRDVLAPLAARGPLLFPGHPYSPRNYHANVLPYRQSSHVLYYTGLARPDLCLVVVEEGPVLFGPPEDLDDVVWHGPHPSLQEEAARAGIQRVEDIGELGAWLRARTGGGRRPLYLPPFHPGVILQMAALLGEDPTAVRRGFDPELTQAVSEQRLIKSPEEIACMESALEVTRDQHHLAMRHARPGMLESEVLAIATRPAEGLGLDQSYPPILSVRGEVLHNHGHANRLESGQLLLNDSGVEGASFYASDITRTFPVDPQFTAEQRALYEIVLKAEEDAIAQLAPGVNYKDVHLHAARVLTEGLIDFGLMKGNASDAVAAGAHALFFPHGVGHVIGLDVHDMEDLGDEVGYAGEGARSSQFGLNFLRLGRPLEAGYVVTIEPGFYAIPALIDRWQGDGLNAEFINFDRACALKGFGGIRIEDDVLVTAEGQRVLGPRIAKSIEEVEALRSELL